MRLVAYHGTRNAAAILQNGFQPSRGGEFGPGVYFSESPDTAAFYAAHVARGPEEPAVLEVELTLCNPHTVTKIDWIRRTQSRTPKTVQAALIRQGYDAIIGIAINGYERQIVVFNPAAVSCTRRTR